MKTKDNRKETNAQAWFSIPSCEAAEMQVRKKSSWVHTDDHSDDDDQEQILTHWLHIYQLLLWLVRRRCATDPRSEWLPAELHGSTRTGFWQSGGDGDGGAHAGNLLPSFSHHRPAEGARVQGEPELHRWATSCHSMAPPGSHTVQTIHPTAYWLTYDLCKIDVIMQQIYAYA